jgi:transcriptional regulator with XRE-family HTH domain
VDTRQSVSDTFAQNLRVLMHHESLSMPSLAKLSGVSGRMIAYILTKERTPTIEIADAIAKAFRLEGWQMMIPDFATTRTSSAKLSELIHHYAQSTEQGRKFISHVAEQESKYASTEK